MRVVITGANRGIGLELVRQVRVLGWQVEACARDLEAATELALFANDRVRLHQLDVTDPVSVRALADALGTAAIDILFNVAGVIGGSHLGQLAEHLTLEEALHAYDVNALGPLRMTVALLPHVRRGKTKKLVHITSGMGSIKDNTSGGAYAYRMSKAALNMMSRSLSVDLRPEGIASFVINPGWVKTDMGGGSAPTPVADSVRGILAEIQRATLADSGEFLNWKGNRFYPW